MADIDDYWEYSDPAASEQRFRAALSTAQGDHALELQTQIARTYSLRKQFGDAHALLDTIEPQLREAGAAPRVRYLLERGRTLNSSGNKADARPLFEEAWALARANGLDGLAVDAAHMVPIVDSGPDGATWTRRGLELARSSNDRKARAMLPALLNNHAWNLYDEARFAEALPVFREAEVEWRRTGKQPQGRIATWSVARCLRALSQTDDALALQLALEREWAAADKSDGYVFEEIAELYELKGDRAAARPYFSRAADKLGKDPQFVASEASRYQRLIERGR
ncbi:MAG: hypothetical protein ACREBN_09880 [Burkholderiaceae bacterium]